MKVALVTSRITYVPHNYLAALEAVVRLQPQAIGGLILIDNVDLSILKSAAGLAALGCFGVARTLISNLTSLLRDPRERLFREARLPVIRLNTMNSMQAQNWIESHQIDLIVNMRTRCIYKEDILKKPRLGCINIHHGLLPDYRGTMCDLNALAEGRDAGFSIHVMNQRIDAGSILSTHIVAPAGANQTDYLMYLELCAQKEGLALSELIGKISELNQLPHGIPNEPKKPIYTRNPNRHRIREMRARGLRL